MRYHFFILSFLVSWIMIGSAFAEGIQLGSVSGTGVTETELAMVRDLFQDEVSGQDGTEKNGVQIIDVKLNRLQKKFLVTATSKNSTGGVLRTEKTKLGSLDEMDVAAKRLVSALVENNSLEKTAERGVVLENEQQEVARVKAISGWQINLGGSTGFSNALLSHKPMFAFGAGYMWEVNRWLIEVRSDFALAYNEASMNSVTLTVGGHYVWKEGRQWAIYSGLESGFGHVEDNSWGGKSGFVVAGDVGLILLRQASVNFDVRFRTTVQASQLNGDVPVIGTVLFGIRF